MKVRRVTTGHSPNGKAIFISDTEVEGYANGLMPGSEFHRLWGADKPARFPDDGMQPEGVGYFPPLGGYRFMMFTVAQLETPASLNVDRRALMNDLQSQLPGLAEHMERGNPGMHTTDTIDFEYIVSGEVWLELDDGATVHLRAGDTVVQNGTRHAWRNRSTEPCHIVVFMVGVSRNPTGLAIARGAA